MKNIYPFPRFIAHRGFSNFAPENTITSLRKAHENGFQMVEFDVQESSDGVLLLMHDESIERTTGKTGVIGEMQWEIIKNINANRNYELQFPNEKVPNIEQVFHILSECNLNANLEIKPTNGRNFEITKRICMYIHEYWPSHLPIPIISSFSRECLIAASEFRFREGRGKYYIGCLYEDLPSDWLEFAKEIRAESIHLEYSRINASLIRTIKNQGFWLLCYTVEDEASSEKLFKMGVDGIFTGGGLKIK